MRLQLNTKKLDLYEINRKYQKEETTIHPETNRINRRYNNTTKRSLDLFGGSGTTLIACENLNRKCYMMELDEKYCDVIIKRWENYTGEKAVKING